MAQARSQSWLALLLSDAPAGEIEALRVSLRGQASSDEERKAIDEQARQALQLLADLSERRQRSAELAALLDLAGRLSGLRDVVPLLQEIVTQARRLLAVDLAYLAVLQPDGTLRIQVTAGSMGDGLRGAELSPRTGIAGRVAETMEPFRTADYLSEPAIVHSGDVDAIAAGERIGAIAGVPLRVADRVEGVLFAAERSRRDFTDGEVSLLASLAAHAAVAIENARLFEELTAANAQLYQQHELTQRAIALHERLTGVVLGGGSVDDVIAALAEVVPGRIELAPPGAEVAAGRDAHRTVVPVMAGEDRLGSLVAVTDASPTAADVRLLERSASTIALVLLSERAVVEAHSRSRNELLDALLSNPGDRDIEARLRGAGIDTGRSYVVVVVAPTPDTKHAARALAEGLAGVGLAGEHQGSFVALIEGEDGGKVVDWVRSRGESVGTVAVAGPASGTTAIAAAYDEARRGVRLLAALDRSGAVAAVDELGPFRYLFDQAGAGDASRFVETAIGALLEHDRLRRGDLVATLEAYFATAQQHAATAATLGIHANTLYQRLARIGELLGDDWRSRSLELHLALRLHDVSARIAAG